MDNNDQKKGPPSVELLISGVLIIIVLIIGITFLGNRVTPVFTNIQIGTNRGE
jgi:Flp pilus assembly pilin Flp